MPATLPPPPTQPAPRESRPWIDFDRLSQPRKAERFTIGSAILLTLLFHGALFFWVLPWVGNVMKGIPVIVTLAKSPPPAPAIEYVLTPLTPEDKQAVRFVETNPAAPTSVPPPTINISNRDQTAAQPKPDDLGHADMPATTGDVANSPKVVSGDLHPAEAPAPPPTPAQSARPAAPPPTAPPVAYSPPVALPGKLFPPDGDGVQVSDLAGNSPDNRPPDKTPPSAKATPTPYKLPPGPLTPETVAASAAAVNPLSRPNLQPATHAGPVAKNTQGTNHLGALAPDARLTPFGTYLNQMQEAIGQQWDNECEQFQFSMQDSGTQVDVVFTMNSRGEVENVQVEKSTATRAATLLCVTAIKAPSPYGVWTKEMVAMLGERYTLHFTFYYL